MTTLTGDCVVTAATVLTEGSCKNGFKVDAGFRTIGGADLGVFDKESILLDINFEEVVDLSLIYVASP